MAKIMTMEMVDQLIFTRGQFCPFCWSKDIEKGDMTIAPESVSASHVQEAKCSSCESEWGLYFSSVKLRVYAGNRWHGSHLNWRWTHDQVANGNITAYQILGEKESK